MKQDIALVLSGGAARGLAHIGVIQELDKHYNITSIAGNSMGAFIGAIYAAGRLDDFCQWIEHLEKKDIIKLLDPTISRQGIIKGEKLFQNLDNFIPDINIEDLSIPYVAVAADISNGKEMVFNTGSLKVAVRASIAIPAIFKPVIINDALIVDGGMVNPIPLNRAIRHQGDILVGSFVNADTRAQDTENISSAAPKTKKFKYKVFKNWNSENYFKIMNNTIGLLTHSLAVLNIEKYPPDILIKISKESCGNFQFHRFREMIKIGQQATQDLLQHPQKPLDSGL